MRHASAVETGPWQIAGRPTQLQVAARSSAREATRPMGVTHVVNPISFLTIPSAVRIFSKTSSSTRTKVVTGLLIISSVGTRQANTVTLPHYTKFKEDSEC
ncbi:hypothetical protein Q31a_40260 [Aureliella helgolandensis]|uniref:Uncharacterized protein n=1 Tax=Aureliella helgolandensis TaxID=2527968 RepID=A0A518GAV0_9BACT|nr:hypothetical protein Q31a_40260 [Aureliella helgolandensis]